MKNINQRLIVGERVIICGLLIKITPIIKWQISLCRLGGCIWTLIFSLLLSSSQFSFWGRFIVNAGLVLCGIILAQYCCRTGVASLIDGYNYNGNEPIKDRKLFLFKFTFFVFVSLSFGLISLLSPIVQNFLLMFLLFIAEIFIGPAYLLAVAYTVKREKLKIIK